MITNLSANREIEDYEEEDAFDFIIKADAIRYFLEDNLNSLEKNKMLALYGNWGSGKTSLMRHIEKEINRGIYYPIFFEAWVHEKDDNLALSLCDAITAEIEDDVAGKIKNFRIAALNVLKGFTSAISVKLGGPLVGSEINFDGAKIIEALDQDTKKDHSFFVQNKEFKESFLAIEELLLQKKNATRIIVFVDDLDRCEPENVLNLITALKLFFTFGQHTIFFAGLDKEAVTKAVKTKYQDVIKSEEYLEKVFDITFGMPKAFSLNKYLAKSFYGDNQTLNQEQIGNIAVIEDFFQTIKFTNPRHIKKILNKYEILCAFKVSESIPATIRAYIPSLIFKQEKGNLFESIICLYFIILYENHFEQFEEIENYESKLNSYIEPRLNFGRTQNANYAYEAAKSGVIRYLHPNLRNLPIKDLIMRVSINANQPISFTSFLFIFSSGNISTLNHLTDIGIADFLDHFPDNNILNSFCKFLINYKDKIEESDYSNYIFWNYFRMAKYLL